MAKGRINRGGRRQPAAFRGLAASRPACRVFMQSLVIAHWFVLGALVAVALLALVLTFSDTMMYRVTARMAAGQGCSLS